MSSRRFSYAPGTRLDWKCSRESVRGETFSRRNGGQNCRVGTFARRDRGQNSREGTFARRDGGQNSRDETFARGDLQGFTKFTQLHVVTSQFVMVIPCALRARIEDRTGSRHDLVEVYGP